VAPTKPPTSTLFRGALLVTQDARRSVRRGDLRIAEGRVTDVGEHVTEPTEEIVDASAFALVPGFVNAHTHVAMGPLRGVADDRDLGGFLERLFAIDAKRAPDDLEAGAAQGIAEMLLGGTTSFLDLYYGQDAVARAVDRLGIRGFLGWAVLDPDKTTQSGRPVDNARSFIERWSNHRRITPLVAPQGVYVCSDATWLEARDLAREKGTLLHYHLSETRREVHEHEAKTGKRPGMWLDAIGALGPGQIAAHGVWLTAAEIERLSQNGVAVAHCPSSNLKLAVGGICPVDAMRSAGVVVGLGTDSVASNNSLSMLREMHLAGVLQKHHRWDATALPAQAVLDLATVEGAKLLGRSGDLGSLEVGKRADLLMVNLRHPTMVPARPEAIVSHLAYSASDEAIDSVYVDGRCLVRHREFLPEPWTGIREAAERAAAALWS
jgi:5-methylthioadenosine/S-adenosylhomocysteine deaminase